MAIVLSVISGILAAVLAAALIGFCWVVLSSKCSNRVVFGGLTVVAIIAIAIGVAVVVDTASKQAVFEADPKAYALAQAQAREGYYTVVALEEGGVLILEDPVTGALIAKSEAGYGRSQTTAMVPILDPEDGTPLSREEWERMKASSAE